EAAQVLGGEALVHLAVPLPQDDLDPRLPGDVAAQELVRQEDDAPAAERLDDLDRVGRSAADVRLGLHGRGRVDVADHRNPGVTLAQEAHVVRRDRGGQGATRLEIGNQDGLFGAEELGGFGYEVDARQDDHFGVGPGGGSGERE